MKTVSRATLFCLLLAGTAQAQHFWIIGGQNAQQGQFPWVTDIRLYGDHTCGGTLIAPQWILTAAHCMPDQSSDLSPFTFRVNDIRTVPQTPSPGSEVRNGVLVFVHPGWTGDLNSGYDIALVKLNEPVTGIAPIALPALPDTNSLYTAGSPIKVAGWGMPSAEPLSLPDTLLYCTSKIYNFNICNQRYDNELSSRIFCIGFTNGEQESGAAAGDSGGPAWIERNGTKTIVGLVSGGMLSHTAVDTPGLFTKVAMYRPWIDSIIQRNGGGGPTATGTYAWNDDEIKIGMGGHMLQLYIGVTGVQRMICELYNAEGRKVYSTAMYQPSYKSYTLDMQHLSSSMYILRMYDPQSGKYYTRKIANTP